MPLFKSLASIGINRAQLADLANTDIIRVEKQLIAENRLNGTISKNDINEILTVLKDYADVVKIICGYNCFYGILTGYDAEHIDTLKLHSKDEFSRIRHVVSIFFVDEITEYINTNVSSNNWNNVRVLLYYRKFFSHDIINILSAKLEGKIDYALKVMGDEPSHSQLKKQVGYINTREFFEMLGEVNPDRFIAAILKLIAFMASHVEYSKATVFFDRLIRAMYYYDRTNRSLRATISAAYRKYGGQQRIIYIFWGIVGFIVVCFFLYVGNLPTHYHPRTNFWENQRDGVLGREDYDKEEVRIKMEDFIEARLYSLNYPMASWRSSVTPLKYRNPFSSDIFDNFYGDIKHGGSSVNIFNHTTKECIVIAYFYQYYDKGQQLYVPVGRNRSYQLYALYIPPGDSISIDNKMWLLRFYMGRRLSSFNTYRQYVYPDSADVKFSKFTPADSLLFAKGFIPENYLKGSQKTSNLSITQPTPFSYRIDWDGATALHQYIDWAHVAMRHYPDSAMQKRPLIFDVKRQVRDSIPTNDPIDSFLQ